jgi:hypothetical protein
MSSTPKIATLADIKKGRSIVATAPSGHAYRIRPLNMERYALAGGLPPQLRQMAMKGAEGINALLGADDEALEAHGSEARDYMDGLVRQVIVEPDLSKFELVENEDGSKAKVYEVDLDELPPVDYRWAANIALGEEDRDGEGRRLWGREPLSVWDTFRDHHECPEDCESCHRMVASLADAQRGSDG